MTRCAGWRGTGFARMAAGMQESLDAARSVWAVAAAHCLRCRARFGLVASGVGMTRCSCP